MDAHTQELLEFPKVKGLLAEDGRGLDGWCGCERGEQYGEQGNSRITQCEWFHGHGPDCSTHINKLGRIEHCPADVDETAVPRADERAPGFSLRGRASD